jgi:hypothetical protein
VDSLWSIITKPKNRQILQWIGGGVIIVATGAGATVAYFGPHHGSEKVICTQRARVPLDVARPVTLLPKTATRFTVTD